MVRLMLTPTPCIFFNAAVALSTVLDTYIDPRMPDTRVAEGGPASVTDTTSSEVTHKKKKDGTPAAESTQQAPVEELATWFRAFSTILEKGKSSRIASLDSRALVIGVAIFLLLFFAQHCS